MSATHLERAADPGLTLDEARARVAAMTPAQMADVVDTVVASWTPLQAAALAGVLAAAREAAEAGESPRAAALRLCEAAADEADGAPFEPGRDDYLASIHAAITRALELTDATPVPALAVRAEPRGVSGRSVQVRCADGTPVEFHTRPMRRDAHYLVTEVLERWVEETRWPFLSATPVAGDRALCWRVLARASAEPHLPACEFVLRMRSGPGVWDLRNPSARPTTRSRTRRSTRR